MRNRFTLLVMLLILANCGHSQKAIMETEANDLLHDPNKLTTGLPVSTDKPGVWTGRVRSKEIRFFVR